MEERHYSKLEPLELVDLVNEQGDRNAYQALYEKYKKLILYSLPRASRRNPDEIQGAALDFFELVHSLGPDTELRKRIVNGDFAFTTLVINTIRWRYKNRSRKEVRETDMNLTRMRSIDECCFEDSRVPFLDRYQEDYALPRTTGSIDHNLFDRLYEQKLREELPDIIRDSNTLSKNELACVLLALKGFSEEEIARKNGLKKSSVGTLLTNVRKKLRYDEEIKSVLIKKFGDDLLR